MSLIPSVNQKVMIGEIYLFISFLSILSFINQKVTMAEIYSWNIQSFYKPLTKDEF